MSYARGTKTDADVTQAQIQSTLRRFGAEGFMSGQQRHPTSGLDVAMVAFQYQGKMIRFTMTLPEREEYRKSPGGQVRRTEAQRDAAWDQGCKERWRALLLTIKAKLVAIESKIATLEEEFMAWIVMPNGRTAGETFLPRIEDAAKSGDMPQLTWDGKL